MIYTYPIKPNCCSACGNVSDVATIIGEGRPNPGDYIICAYCATIGRLNFDWSIYPVLQQELLDMPSESREMLLHWQKRVREFHKKSSGNA